MNLVSYIRVSKVGGREGDSFQSPDQQRKAIESFLPSSTRLVAEFVDLDESGGSMDRPGVKAAVEMVESGQVDGIICANLDRWARTVEALTQIKRWAKEGKTFISVADNFDANTPQGSFALTMMLAVATYYRDLISKRWDDATANAIGRGVHVTIPFGYRRGDGVGRAHADGGAHGQPLVIFEAEAEIVRRIFADRLAGSGAAAIADSLNADEVKSPRGKLWTRQSVRALLRVRAYMGDASRGDQVHADAHEAIILPADWRAAQTERQQPNRNNHSLLAGLVRCAGCGYMMGSGTSRSGRRYNCGRHHSELECPSPTTAGSDALEALVSARFLARYGALEMVPHALTDTVSDAQTALDAAQAEFVTWRDDGEMREILGAADYRNGLKARKLAINDAEQALRDAMRQSDATEIEISPDIWTELDSAERRGLLTAGIDAVIVSRAASTHADLSDRTEILWTGELENDGSRAGMAGAVRSLP